MERFGPTWQEQQALNVMVTSLLDRPDSDRSPPPSAIDLLRFLRAHNGDSIAAANAYVSDRRWRTQIGVVSSPDLRRASSSPETTSTGLPFESEPWFDRSSKDSLGTERKLHMKAPGSFLVSRSSEPGCLSLVCKSPSGLIGRHKIRFVDKGGFVCDGSNKVYETVEGLLRSLPFVQFALSSPDLLRSTRSVSHPTSCSCIRRPFSIPWISRDSDVPQQQGPGSPPTVGASDVAPDDFDPRRAAIIDLPASVLVRIFSHVVDVQTFVSASRVCHSWNRLAWSELRCFPDADPNRCEIDPNALCKVLQRRAPRLKQLFLPRAAALEFAALSKMASFASIESLTLHLLRAVPERSQLPPRLLCLSLGFMRADLRDENAGPARLVALAGLPRLRWLELAFFESKLAHHTMAEALASVTALKKLTITGPFQGHLASSEGGRHSATADLVALPSLRQLHLHRGSEYGDEFHFSPAPSMRRLLLTNARPTKALDVRRLARLNCLEIDAGEFGEARPDASPPAAIDASQHGLPALQHLEQLRVPSLAGLAGLGRAVLAHLVHLALPFAAISDEELEYASTTCCRLRRLYVSSPTRLTDACVPVLAGWTSLVSLTFLPGPRCRLSAAGLFAVAALCRQPWDGWSADARVDLASAYDSLVASRVKEDPVFTVTMNQRTLTYRSIEKHYVIRADPQTLVSPTSVRREQQSQYVLPGVTT